jgi:hypothetical protein
MGERSSITQYMPSLIPEYVWILCPTCRKSTVRIASYVAEDICTCSAHVKNPYYKEETTNAGDDVRPKEE